jgi:uncharacterized low-complexity protein
MQKRITIAVLALLLLVGGAFTFARVSYAADNAATTAAVCTNQTLTSVAELLKIDANTLVSRLKNGETLAAIATAQGVDRSNLVSTLVKGQSDRIEQLVTAGRWTRERADAYLAQLQTKVTAAIDSNTSWPFQLGPGGRGLGNCGQQGTRGPGSCGQGSCAGNGHGRGNGQRGGNGQCANTTSQTGR